VDVPFGVGKVKVDIGYGGMWYAIVDAASVGLTIVPEHGWWTLTLCS
jgi:proline racemase